VEQLKQQVYEAESVCVDADGLRPVALMFETAVALGSRHVCDTYYAKVIELHGFPVPASGHTLAGFCATHLSYVYACIVCAGVCVAMHLSML
jgi:hypothetical protein